MFLSIMGMYEYDNTLFDGLTVPTYTDKNNVIHTVNKNSLINNILLQCAELEVLYPNFDTMKLAINVWSDAEQDSWNKLYATQKAVYNPIWNVDADETDTFGQSITHELAHGHVDTRTPSLTNTHAVKGFNSNTWSDSDKVDESGTDTHTHSGKDTTTERIDNSLNKRRTGNIGVTATQDLIKKEREIAEFNIINYITLSFKQRFCLLVY